MSGAGFDRLGRRNRGGNSRRAPADLREGGSGLARFVGHQKMIGGGIAQRVEEAPAAMRVSPALRMHSLGVVAHVEKVRPGLIVEILGPGGPRNMGLAAIGKFELRALSAK